MDKVVSVRLKLLYDQFVKGAKDSGKAVEGIGDSAEKSTKKASRNWEELGQRTSDMGSKLTSGVTVPLLAAGAAMTVMATQFDNTFVTMQATAGVAEDEVDGLKESVLDLARETGRAPQELAEALLAVRSSGLAGAAAMDVLEMSAKGAASGMGDTREIANTLTSVIAAYGAENITAAQAMDVLVAAVQQGKAEAAEMAPQFGRLLPVAAELGVAFHDVAGALAFLTRGSGDASQSATQVSGVLAKLLKPSQAGAEALKEIGISAFEVKGQLAERGLLGTLQHLRKEMTQSQFQALFDDIEAMNGALALTGPNGAQAQAVIDAVANSAGNAETAFEKWASSMGAKQARAWASLQAGLIEFGDLVVPTISEIIEFLGKLVDVIADLPEPAQKLIIAFAGVAAASGPMLTLGGNLVKTFNGASGILEKVGTSALGMSAGFGASAAAMASIAPLVIFAGLALQDYINTKAEAKRLTEGFAEAIAKEKAGLEGEIDAFALAKLTTGKLGTALREAGADLKLFAEGIQTSGDELQHLAEVSVFDREEEVRKLADEGSRLGQELERLMDSDFDKFGTLIDTLGDMSSRFEDGAIASEDMDYAVEQLGEESELAAEKQDLLKQALQETIDTMRAAVDPFFAMQDAIVGVRDAQTGWEESQRKVTEAQVALDEAIAAHGPNSEQAAEAARNLTEAENGVTDAQWNAASASVNLVAAGEELRRKMAEQGLSAEDAKTKIFDWAVQAGFSEDEARILAGGIDGVTAALDRIPGVTETRIIVKTVYETTQHGSRGGPGFVLHEGGYVPGPRGREIAGLLLGGEEVLHWDDPRHSSNLMRNLTPHGALMGEGRGATVVSVAVDMRGAIISSQADAQRWVADAWNRAAAGNLVTVRGRPL